MDKSTAKQLLGGVVATKTQSRSMPIGKTSNEGLYLLEQSKQTCALNKNILAVLNSLESFDCDDAKVCINAELALPSAGALTNFGPAVIAAYESHIAAGGADPEFCGEMLACLQAATPAVVDAVATILNTALSTSPNPILSNLCDYINYCIDSGFLAVSADSGNLITTGTDGGAFIDTATIVAQIPATTNVIDSVGNTLTSTVDGVSDTATIINSVVSSVDANGDFVTTINGVASAPLDLGSILDIDDQQLSSAGNTISLTNGGTATAVNSNVLSSAGLVVTSTVNGVADSEDLTSGVQALIDSNTDALVSSNTGHVIATHTAVDNTVVDIEETVTALVYSEPNITDGGLSYTDEEGTINFIKLSHTVIVTPTPNTQTTITHGLNSTRVITTAYDVATDQEVGVEFMNRTANTIDFVSTTGDQLEIIIKK